MKADRTYVNDFKVNHINESFESVSIIINAGCKSSTTTKTEEIRNMTVFCIDFLLFKQFLISEDYTE